MPFADIMIADKTALLSWTVACNLKPSDRVNPRSESILKKDQSLATKGTLAFNNIKVKCSVKPINSCLDTTRLTSLEQKMLNQQLIISDPALDINSISEKGHCLRRRNAFGQSLSLNKAGIRGRNPSIRQKISEWEGKSELTSLADRQQWEKKDATEVGSVLDPLGRPEDIFDRKTEPKLSVMLQLDIEGVGKENECQLDDEKAKGLATEHRLVVGKENGMSKPDSSKLDLAQPLITRMKEAACTKLSTSQSNKRNKSSVLCHIEKLEEVLKDSPKHGGLQLPGSCYIPQRQEEADRGRETPVPQEEKDESCSSELKRKHLRSNSESEASEPIFGTADSIKVCWASCKVRNVENVYSEPGAQDQETPVNPVPKPKRTFRYGPEQIAARKSGRRLPDLPPVPPPLPSSPPPAVSTSALGGRSRSKDLRRKSFEFEDMKCLQMLQLSSLLRQRQLDGSAVSSQALNSTVSEENIYEDIVDPPKENLYEDIETADRRFTGKHCVRVRPSSAGTTPKASSPSGSRPGTPTKLPLKTPGLFRHSSERRSFKLLDLRKSNKDGVSSPSKASPPSTPSSPDETLSLPGDSQQSRRRKKIPKVVLKINAIYEARRGKKKVKRISQSLETSTGRVTDENSETDSETEEKLKAHSQRLVQIQSMLKQTGRYRTLERDLMELQEWRLFEFFVVVALHVRKEGGAYVPEVTQQFPLKLDKQFKFMRETEDQLKAIPKFCFPDARDWNHICQFTSETFSFVLTGEDGSRRFGYCRRLLPSGKGRCLPEVYCIVSRLGCFNLFSKILDEVEKRRMISPALVQPFMRSIMEAPFPAPGRTITVKNFVPGSGNEVIHLCRPLDSRLEHVDFHCLFSCLSVRQLIKVFASLLLERRVIFTADRLSTLSQCCHAVVALLYPFTWQHTYIPVLPPSMIDIVCSPTPFLIGLLSSSLPKLRDLPIEEVLVLNLGANKFFRQVDDEDCILPRKLQVALEQVLEQRNELANQEEEEGPLDRSAFLDMVVSEAFVRFFVEVVGHYSLYMTYNEKEERSFLWEAFRKSVRSKSLRRFLEIFMETQMFRGFVQEREMRKLGIKGLFEVRAQDYLDSLPGSEQGGMNRFLRGLGSKMKFLQKK